MTIFRDLLFAIKLPENAKPAASELLCSQVVFAELDVWIVGFAAVRESYLSFLNVHPDHFRQGIGSLLLDASTKPAVEVPWTSVLSGNEPALSL